MPTKAFSRISIVIFRAMAIRIRYMWNLIRVPPIIIQILYVTQSPRSSPQSLRIFFPAVSKPSLNKVAFPWSVIDSVRKFAKKSLVSHSQGVVWPSLWFLWKTVALGISSCFNMAAFLPPRNTCESKTTTTNQWGSSGSLVDLDQ